MAKRERIPSYVLLQRLMEFQSELPNVEVEKAGEGETYPNRWTIRYGDVAVNGLIPRQALAVLELLAAMKDSRS